MARPLRIEFSGALYHITSRGDRREAIYEDDEDREMFLGVLAEVVERYNWICHAFCLMTNHYHLVIETVEGNLSQGMRQLNGVYTQASNRRHNRLGHLFQGRFKGILVDKDAYLLELSRYVVLNPVRAGMVDSPGQWPWSSYRAMMGESPVPKWLAVDGLLSQFGLDRGEACQHYRRFVLDGVGRGIWEGLRQQIYLGDEAFVERMQNKAKIEGDALTVPQAQRRPPAPPLADIAASHIDRNAAIVAAYATGAYSAAAPFAEPVRVPVRRGLRHGSQCQLVQRLHCPVVHTRDTEGSFLQAVLLRDVNTSQWLRFVATSAQAASSPPFDSGTLPQDAVNARGFLPPIRGHPLHSQQLGVERAREQVLQDLDLAPPTLLHRLCDTHLQPSDFAAGQIPIDLSPQIRLVNGGTGRSRQLLSHFRRFSKLSRNGTPVGRGRAVSPRPQAAGFAQAVLQTLSTPLQDGIRLFQPLNAVPP